MASKTIFIQWSAERIRDARLKAKLTQQDLADLLGCRMQTVCEWENGKYSPQNAYQKLLSVAFRK